MKLDNRRKYHRINFEGMVSLHFYRRSYDYLKVKDLSLTGMSVLGKLNQRKMENCQIRIFHSDQSGNNCLRALAEIVWRNDDEAGLKFTKMNLEDYVLLQTTLIYQAEQPDIILSEFPKNCPFEVSN